MVNMKHSESRTSWVGQAVSPPLLLTLFLCQHYTNEGNAEGGTLCGTWWEGYIENYYKGEYSLIEIKGLGEYK